MEKITDIETYLNGFDKQTKIIGADSGRIREYVIRQKGILRELIDGISGDSFWQVFPLILGIDSKLAIIYELIKFDEFSSDEIILIAENDYRSYYKELCGYNKNAQESHSIIFQVT